MTLPAAKLALAVKRARAQSGAAELLKSEPIAIIGMGCRLPGKTNSPDAFWALLRDGVDAIIDLPRGRWSPSLGVPRCQGGFLEEVDRFDAEFFGIPPRESEQLDPQHRMLMEVVWESLWDARLRPEALAGSRSGVFAAVYNNDYFRLQFAHPGNINAYTSSGTSHSTAVGRISFLLDWKGPSIAIDTACSSSLVAIHLACQSLRAGECQLAVAGGTSLILAPEELISLTKLGMLAGDWRCKSFDSRADGFVPGEGCGIVVLKLLSDALADGDTIRAIIRGTAVNQDGRTTVLTAPNGLSQQEVIRSAHANAQIAPSDISYVEAHGTGTALGDPIELEALSEVLAGDGAPCFIGSVKTNFGHLEAAAGVSGLMKVVLALEHEEIPKNLHFRRLNPHIQIEGTRLEIADRAIPWPRGAAPRFAGVSSFGFGGTNAHVVLEEAPHYSLAQREPVTPHPWKKQRYWSVAQPAALEVRSSVHPLLGRRLSSPAIEGTVFENVLSAESPSFLGDHAPGGRILLPLSACIEMFLAASGVGAIEDVVVQEALELPSSGACQVQVIVNGETLRLFSLQNGNWKLHASARTASAGQPLPQANIEEFRRSAGRQSDADEYYAALESRGLQFGPAFRLIDTLWTSEGGALARVRPPASIDGYRLHPALLDACFQALGELLPADATYLPLGLRRFELFRNPGSGELWSRASIQPGTTNSIKGDLTIFDSDGQPVASVEGLWLRNPVSGDEEQCLCEIEWQSQPRADAPQSEVSGKWLVLADAGGIGMSVAAGLEAAGAHCITVARGEKFEELLRTVSLAGVVYLWALDLPSVVELDGSILRHQTRESCEPVLELVQQLASKDGEPPHVWIITRNAQPADIQPGRVSLVQAPLWGLASTIRREHPALRCVTIDVDSQLSSAEHLLDEIRHPDGEEQIAWRGETRFVRRLVKMLNGPTETLRLESDAPGRLEELRWKPSARRKPGRGEVEIRIAASGLNFRDVLNALGEYPGDAGPLGSECAGWIEDVGEGVSGFSPGDEVVAVARGSFARFVTTKADLIARKPSGLGMEDAAAIPVAYVTARYALSTVGKIQSGQKVLIHAAAGGVGLAAVAEAHRVGAEVFATAGSEEKRAWLRSLGVRHIMNSRDLNYGREILELTEGRGVDLVLNSLSGEHIAESLRVLASGGIFLELGKKGIWDAERVAGFRADVRYAVIDWGEEYDRAPELIAGVFCSVIQDVQQGVLKILPCKTFPEKEAISAFRWMAQGRHIGKIVVRHAARPKPIVPDAAYLITGGTGALGLRVAKWMAAEGAGELVLVGRNDPTEKALTAIRDMEVAGARVIVRRADVSRRDEVEHLIQEVRRSGKPLRGIVHAAGVLDDGVLTQQSWERFENVMAPKLEGAWHLHELTSGMSLDFFVMFSSLASLLGSPGQGNYAAANAFLDGLAHYRWSLGLPAMSINWGPWKGGMAARPESAGWQRSFPALRALDPEQGVDCLEKLLSDGDCAQFAAFLLRSKTSIRDLELGVSRKSASDSHAADPAEVPRPVARAAMLRGSELLHYLREEVGKVMGISDLTLLRPEEPLFDAGLDSLMAVEFRNVLSDTFGRPFASTLLFDYPSLQKLSAFLQGSNGDAPNSQSARIAKEIHDLDDSDAEALLNAELNRKD